MTNGTLLGRVLLIPLIIGGALLAVLLLYPAVLLGVFSYAYVLRGGQEAAWYVNLTLITLILTCASVVLYLLRRRRLVFRLCIYDCLVLMLAALLLIGSLHTPDPMAGLLKTARFAGLVALPYFLARVILVTPQRLHLLASTLLYLSLAIAGLLVVTHLAPEAVPEFLISEQGNQSRAQFLDTNQVPLATFLVVGVILALLKGRKHNLLFTLPAIALLLYATLLTGTRSPILALGVVGTLYLASVFIRAPSRAMVVILLISFGFTALVLSGSHQDLPNWERFEAAATSPGHDPSIQGRQVLVDDATTMFLNNPLTGGGTGSLSGYPHNIFLELAAENGIAGVGVMVVMILLVGRGAWNYLFRYHLQDDNDRTVAYLALFPFIALLVIKQFSFDLTMHKDLFIFLGVAVNLPLLVSTASRDRHHLPVSAAHQAPLVSNEVQPHTEKGQGRSAVTGKLSRTEVTGAN